jgi:lysophospholipase L1-like esterase
MKRTLLGSLALLALAAAAGRAGPPVVLVLGDSSAFGETDRTKNNLPLGSNGDRGYVAPFADHLAKQNGGVRPTVMNFAINGETTKSFFSGLVSDRASTDGVTLNSNYRQSAPNYPSQSEHWQTAVRAELAAGNTVAAVAVQIGANDLSYVAEAPGFLDLTPEQQQRAVMGAIAAAQENYARVLSEVRALLPDADLYVMGYHNPYGGAPDHPFHDIAGPAVRGLNQVVEGVGTSVAFGATFVNFYPVIEGRERELTLIDRFPEDLINYVHLNEAGYAAAGAELIRMASPQAVPAPPPIILAGMGLLALAGRRAVRRAA